MGKWASKSHAGSSGGAGFLTQPGGADWSEGSITATTFSAIRIAAIPLPADRWEVLVVNRATGAIAFQNQSNGTPIAVTGLTTATLYDVYIRWTRNLAAVSDWSASKFLTTL